MRTTQLALVIALLFSNLFLVSSERSLQICPTHTFIQQFPTTNWVALQALNSHHLEGKCPSIYPLPQIQTQPILPAVQTALHNTETAHSIITNAIPIQPNYSSVHSNSVSFPISCYQTSVEATHSYDPVRHKQRQLACFSRQLSDLQNQPRGQEIYNARQQIIVSEFDTAIRMAREAIQTPDNPLFRSHEAIAQTTKSLIELSQLKFSNSGLNEKLQKLIQRIQDATTDKITHAYHPYNIHLNGKVAELTGAINKFQNQLNNWLDDPQNLYQQAVEDAHDYLTHYRQSQHQISPSNVWTWKFLNSSDQAVHNQITECAYNKNLIKMDKLCEESNWNQARDLALKNGVGFELMPFQAIYETQFAYKHTREGIDKRFIDDPLYLSHKNQLTCPREQNLLSVSHPLNTELAPRYAKYQEIVTELHIKNPSPEVKQFIYDLIGKDLSNPNGTILPSKTFINLATCKIDTTQRAALVQRAMNYLQQGLSNNPESSRLMILAEANAQALSNPSNPQQVLYLADYSDAPRSVHHAEIQQATIQLIADNLPASKSQAKEGAIVDWDTIQRVDKAYRAMQNGDVKAENYLHQGLIPTVNREFLSVDYDAEIKQITHVKPETQTIIVEQMHACQETTKEILANGAQFELKKYELPSSIKNFLEKNGLDSNKFESLYGHQLQHLIHKDILHQLTQEQELSGLKLIQQSTLARMRDLTLQISDLSRQRNMAGQIQDATMLSNFCWQLIDHVKEGVRGFYAPLRGTISGGHELVSNYATLLRDPIGSTKRWLDNIGHLTETGFRIVYYLDDQLGAITRGTPEQSSAALADLQQKTRHLATQYKDFLQRQGLSGLIEKGFHHGTVLAGDTLVINKTLSVFEKFHTLAKGQIIEHAQRLVSAASKEAMVKEAVATTAEGIQIKAAHAAENFVLSEAQQTKNAAKAIIPEIRQFSPQSIEEGVKYCMSKRKIEHIFDNVYHNLDPLVAKLGGHENTIREILIVADGKLPISGIFENVVVNVSGYEVYIRGRVIDGVPKLGTLYIK